MLQFFIVCPLTALAGFVDAIVGGGGLISLPTFLLAGLPAHYAIGTNKIPALLSVGTATAQYAHRGYIPWRLAALCSVLACAGSALGAQASLLIDERFFLYIMLAVLPATALYVLLSKQLSPQNGSDSSSGGRGNLALCTAISFVTGAYDGFYGPGSGTFMLLLFVGAAQLTLQEANGVSKAIGVATNVASLLTFWGNGKILWALGISAGVSCMVGSYLGARFFERCNQRAIKLLILVVICIFIVKVVHDLR